MNLSKKLFFNQVSSIKKGEEILLCLQIDKDIDGTGARWIPRLGKRGSVKIGRGEKGKLLLPGGRWEPATVEYCDQIEDQNRLTIGRVLLKSWG